MLAIARGRLRGYHPRAQNRGRHRFEPTRLLEAPASEARQDQATGLIVSHATQTRSRQLEDAWLARRQRAADRGDSGRPRSLESVDCVVCPPFVYLAELARLLRDSAVKLGAQDVCAEAQGAYTGEVSAAMLQGRRLHTT